MLGLAVDTSTATGSLAAFRDESLLGILGVVTDEMYSSRLFRHLEFLLGELGLQLDQVELFAVATGPGSFTGLRVGLAAVKGWAATLGRPIAAISVLEAIASQARGRAEAVVPFLDAHRGQVFGGVYQRHGDELVPCGEEVVLSPEEFLAWLKARGVLQGAVLVSPTPEVLAAVVLKELGDAANVERVSPFLAMELARIGRARARQGRLVDALALDANYVRRSDAELKWKE